MNPRKAPASDEDKPQPTLEVTRFERTISLLGALLITFGALVVWLGAVWVTNQVWVRAETVPVELVELPGGSPEGAPGETLRIESTEVQPTDNPTDQDQLEEEPQIEDMLAQVLDALAELPVEIDQPQWTEEQFSAGQRSAVAGTGRRGRGAGGQGAGLPRTQRWYIRYDPGQTLDEYARQLDYFGVELAAIQQGRIVYVSRLSAERPQTRTGISQGEERLYWLWQGRGRRQTDVALLRKAGIDVGDATLLQFYPANVEETLARLEREFAGRAPEEIRRTSFGIRRTDEGYEFYVINQQYL